MGVTHVVSLMCMNHSLTITGRNRMLCKAATLQFYSVINMMCIAHSHRWPPVQRHYAFPSLL